MGWTDIWESIRSFFAEERSLYQGFLCPECKKKAVEIVLSLELGPDGDSDEISLQTITCQHCAMFGIAVYEESRRGGEESWHHWGLVTNDGYVELTAKIHACPEPKNHRCSCDTHQYYGVKEEGRWVGLQRFDASKERFSLRY